MGVVNGWRILWNRTYWSDRGNDHLTYVVVEAEDSPGFYAFGLWQFMNDPWGFPVNQASRDVDELIGLVEMWEREGLCNINGWPDAETLDADLIAALGAVA